MRIDVIKQPNGPPRFQSKFFTFAQNNSYGKLYQDDKQDSYVVVEAFSAKDANYFAEMNTPIYFDGAGDCPCCGHRWTKMYEGEQGDNVPSLYDKPLDTSPYFNGAAIVYTLDGGIVRYRAD